VVDDWIGHSEAIAKRNYLQITESHFAAVSGGESSALQNALQQRAALSGTEGNSGRAWQENSSVFPRSPLSSSQFHPNQWAILDSKSSSQQPISTRLASIPEMRLKQNSKQRSLV
jgi:hypothetical protein